MAAPRKYPEEFRERVIWLVLEVEKGPGSVAGPCGRVGEQFGINPETLRDWV